MATLAGLAPAPGPRADEGDVGATAGNPLANLPSKLHGEHIEKVNALSHNSWAILGQAAPDPTWGTERGRGYSPKMAYAPDLGGAFFCGTGVRGYVKPNDLGGSSSTCLALTELNVHLFYLAGDSGNAGATMLAYRSQNVKRP